MKLIIDRTKWLRGERARKSYLVRPIDNKMCCLGFYGCALGVSSEIMRGAGTPVGIDRLLWNGADWLFHGGGSNSFDTDELMEINDSIMTSAQTREEQIIAIFAKHDVQVEFIN